MGRRASRNHFAGTRLSERASLVLWEEGDWRCEFNPGLAGVGRLEVYQADQLILAEEALSGPSAAQRAEILRQRLLRGNLRPARRRRSTPRGPENSLAMSSEAALTAPHLPPDYRGLRRRNAFGRVGLSAFPVETRR